MRALGLLAPAVLAACAPEPPESVFVPAPSFTLTLAARTSLGDAPLLRVGEPLTLFVRRASGPWVEVGGEAATAGECWWVRPPPDVEPEVADNVRWLVDPPGAAEFNVAYRADHTREVRFERPGDYLLVATEAGSCGDLSTPDTLRVRVISGEAPVSLGAGPASLDAGPGCIRGGSTRDEVRAVMGEPDSISFGAWIYGRSSVSFGYGTVVEVSNEGGNLILC